MKPGDCYDKNGVPIYPGDLCRTPYFRDRKRRQHYLYHVAVLQEGYMRLIPTCHLEPTRANSGGSVNLSQEYASETEVIHGHGPKSILSFEDRPKRRVSRE